MCVCVCVCVCVGDVKSSQLNQDENDLETQIVQTISQIPSAIKYT